ncbi:MAG: PilT/PilU family type 4a pilus ATPase [Planctomycetes bacterium]|nr:PilT/PilU family type 4a pilus ATPase [Planctomycetota bacterium]
MLGEILVEQGLIDEKTLNSILSVQRRKLELSKTGIARETAVRSKLQGAKATTYLQLARELGASDLYLTSAQKPMVRVNGNLMELPAEALSFDECRDLLFSLLSPEQVKRYYVNKYLDFCMEVPAVGRFRTNIFRHFRGIGGIFRVILDDVWPFERLGLPGVVRRFVDLPRGLVLVTGPTGSGKSTTLASLLDLVNRTQQKHIITIEDPIEFIFESRQSMVSQRELYAHTPAFVSALRAALREDPDIIVVGEMRDPETVATAINAAGTGHLVFGTLHTLSAHRTVARILDQFPSQKRAQVRATLATVLKGVVCQQLVPNADGKGRSLASEIMIMTPAIANLIREDRSWQIPMMIQMGRNQGMRLMDDSLTELVRLKKITIEEAVSRAGEKDRFLSPA